MIKRVICLVFAMVLVLSLFGCATDEEQYGEYSSVTKNDDITHTNDSTETTDKNIYNSILTTENKNNVSTDIVTNTNTVSTIIPTTNTNSTTNVTSNTTDSITASSTTTITTDATEGEVSSSTTDDIENTIASNTISDSNNTIMTTTKEPSNSDITEDVGTAVDKIVYNIGDKVYLGEYYKDVQGRHRGAIEWTVIDEKDGNYLLLSKNILDCQAFDTNGNNDFAKSSLNNWLNTTFLNNAFSNEEKARIVYSKYDYSKKELWAYITIPSIPEVIEYESFLYHGATLYAAALGVEGSNSKCTWWLRSTDFISSSNKTGMADCVHYGKIYSYGYSKYPYTHCTREEGIKPMLWYNPNGGQ